MTGEWLSYRFADFIMFSARVYDRQIQLHNESLAGMQVLSVLIGGLILWQGLGRWQWGDRLLAVMLGIVWIFVAWSFLWLRFGEINLIAGYAAPVFAVQGAVLLVIGFSNRGLHFAIPNGLLRIPALLLLLICGVLYPGLLLILGRPVFTAEFFGMMADPTALTTLGILILSRNPVRYVLMIVPILWSAVAAGTQAVLGLSTALAITAILAAWLLFPIIAWFESRVR